MLDAERRRRLLIVQAMLLETTILGTKGEQLLVDDPLNLAPIRSPLYCRAQG